MLTCYLLDDERAALEVLRRFVADTPGLTLAGSATDVLTAAADLKASPADLLFVDIEMPKLTGPQFVELYAQNMGVVFTTAYSEYALQSYEQGVIDYLLKPIAYGRFLKAAEKALRQLRPVAPAVPAATKPAAPEVVGEDFIWVKTEHKGKFQKVDLADIVYVEGQKNYISIVTRQRAAIVTYLGLGELEAKLPPARFARVHRSYLVALDLVVAIDGNEIHLKDAPRIPTAGTYKEEFLRRIEANLLRGKK